MNTDRNDYILALDEELLLGNVMLSEWSTFLAKDAETAFCAEADLATILISQAAIECHLRYEFFEGEKRKLTFYDLIEQSPLTKELKASIHKLRRYRNRWVHVQDPHDDDDLLSRPEYYEGELKQLAYVAIRNMLEVIYFVQGT